MMGMNDLKIGSVFAMTGEPYVVVSAQHVQMGRGAAVLRTKLRHLVSGNVLEETFKHGDKFENIELEHRSASFLYNDDSGSHFMDSQSYDQFALSGEAVKEQQPFLKDGQEYDVLFYNDKPIVLQLPKKVTLNVTETMEGVRGDTAQGSVTKPATVETGLTVNVPLFVKNGDPIIINTETGQYVERA